MKGYSVAIIEDNHLLAFKIKLLLEKEGASVLGIYNSGESFLEAYAENCCDILLIDVMLKGNLTGVDVAKKVREIQVNQHFIFLTAKTDDVTINGIMSVLPDCYIKKPYDDVSLLSNIYLVINKIEKESRDKEDHYITLQENQKLYKLSTEEILFVQSDGNYINVISNTKGQLLFRKKLSDFESVLEGKGFLRVHNRYLINVSHVFHYSYKYVMIDNTQIPISERYRPEVRKHFIELND